MKEQEKKKETDWNEWKPVLDSALVQIDWSLAGSVGDSLGYGNHVWTKGSNGDNASDLQLYSMVKERLEEMIDTMISSEQTDMFDEIGFWKLNVSKKPNPQISIKFVVTGTAD